MKLGMSGYSQGENTNADFCKWLFTEEHKDCIVVAYNFQGYDGYFIQNFLNENGVKYEVIFKRCKDPFDDNTYV